MNENKKQCLYSVAMVALALIIGIATLFCIKKYDVHAEETKDMEKADTNTAKNILLGSCKNIMHQTVMWYAPGKSYYYCCYKAQNGSYVVFGRGDSFGNVQSFITYADIIGTNGSSTNTGNFVLNNEGYYTIDGFYLSADSLELKIPKFSSADKAILYAKGQIDVSEADNYNEIKSSFVDYSYDENYPYFDQATLTINANNSANYNARMSDEMQTNYYMLNAKNPDKDGTSEEEHTMAYVEYYAAAIYADSSKVGIFNDLVLRYGNAVGSMSSSLPNGAKMDEIIQYDADGKLLVSAYKGISTVGFKQIAKEDSTSPLLAVELDKITAADKEACGTNFSRVLTAKKEFVYNDMDATDYIVGGSLVPKVNKYTLIGYAVDIRMSIQKGNEVVYSKDTYTYNWLNNAMRERYGSESVFYDDAGKMSGDSFEFNNQGQGITSGISSDGYTQEDITGYIKNGFGLLGKDGYLTLMGAALYQIPAYIWAIIAFVLAVYAGFLLLKFALKFI